MDKNNKIIIIIAVVLILICLIFAMSKKEDSEIKENNGEEEIEISVDYREMTNEITGDTYYQVYNEETGEIIANVAEEYQVDLYLDNPYYEEAEITEDNMNEEMSIEVLEP